MKLIGKKIGLLSETLNDKVLWQGKNSTPPIEVIKKSTSSLIKRSFIIKPLQSDLFELSNVKLLDWIGHYIENEKAELEGQFLAPNKYFNTLLLQSDDKAELNLMFRLMTVGVEGWTGYRISWVRNRNDLFTCKEH